MSDETDLDFDLDLDEEASSKKAPRYDEFGGLIGDDVEDVEDDFDADFSFGEDSDE